MTPTRSSSTRVGFRELDWSGPGAFGHELLRRIPDLLVEFAKDPSSNNFPEWR